MKTRIILIIALFFISCSIANSKEEEIRTKSPENIAFNVYTSPDLYNLTLKWVEEYGKLDPTLKINVIKSADNHIPEMLNEGAGIGFTADESFAHLNGQSIWNMVVGRDVIVPVMNINNPLVEEICRKGITPKGLLSVLENAEKQSWDMLLGNTLNNSAIPLNCYMANDPSVQSGVGNFLNNNQVSGFKLVQPEELISIIQKEPAAFGFCRLIQIIDPANPHFIDRVKLVPIDKNGNGKIDYMEDIYNDLQTFSRGVWIGKYPQALSGTVYSVSSVKPENEAEVAFLKWVLTDGQQFLSTNGYCELIFNEKQSQLDKFNDAEPYKAASPDNAFAVLKVMLWALVALGLAGFLLDIFVRRIKKHKVTTRDAGSSFLPVFEENSVIVPKGLYFDKTHTWAFMKKDGTVKVGIDDFLQHITGTITRIEMKNAGEKIRKGELLLTLIRKGKQLNIYSPVSGTIKTQNKNLETHSSLINSAPYADGWVYEIEPTNWLLEIQFMTMAEKYGEWLKNEFSRLKDFFAVEIKADTPEYAMVILQDGGALKDNILADLGPEVWEDFQTKFIDTSR